MKDGKVILLLGPRQTGKSTLLRERFAGEKVLWLDGDDYDVQAVLTKKTSSYLKNLLEGKERLIIDEALNIQGIGLTLKQIHDLVKGIEVIVTGSSAFEISSKANEPLTGRK
ncbi:MAG: AAA family ATPase [Saprospiraceae bacterium]|nr:AAA family ATPase [Saprospiraceae bacterium]